jgi:hypothetical protein
MYRLNDHHEGEHRHLPGGLDHYPVSNVQKLTTNADIFWDGETTFTIAFPIFYVEARDFVPHTTRKRDSIDHYGWPSPNWPDGSDQKRVDWREKETMHARHLGEFHDGVQWMPTPFGLACTGRNAICHDYAPRGRNRKSRICVNCIHKAMPIQLFDEYYRKGEMRIYSKPPKKTTGTFARWSHTVSGEWNDTDKVWSGSINFGDWATDPTDRMVNQHVVYVHLAELESEQDMGQLDLWYDLKLRSPYIFYTPGTLNPDGSRDKGVTTVSTQYGSPTVPSDSRILLRPRTDTVSKGRIYIDPSIQNRLSS